MPEVDCCQSTHLSAAKPWLHGLLWMPYCTRRLRAPFCRRCWRRHCIRLACSPHAGSCDMCWPRLPRQQPPMATYQTEGAAACAARAGGMVPAAARQSTTCGPAWTTASPATFGELRGWRPAVLQPAGCVALQLCRLPLCSRGRRRRHQSLLRCCCCCCCCFADVLPARLLPHAPHCIAPGDLLCPPCMLPAGWSWQPACMRSRTRPSLSTPWLGTFCSTDCWRLPTSQQAQQPQRGQPPQAAARWQLIATTGMQAMARQAQLVQRSSRRCGRSRAGI